MRPKTIGVIGHTGKTGVAELVRDLTREFDRLLVKVLVESKTAALAGAESSLTIADLARQADLLVVLGGDGTILNVVSQLQDVLKPIFGINIGSLGFLTCLNSSAYQKAVESIVSGQLTFSERALLKVAVRTNDRTIVDLIGLNDAVISRGEVSRLIRLKTRVNGEPLTEFNADGLIVATPTGSTAYSLSAGGPILSPGSGVFVITPICPHVLTNRSIIVEENAVIEVEVSQSEDHPVYLTVDGGQPLRVESGSLIELRKAEKTLPLAALPDMSFFSVVRQKLKWSGSNL
jgi:NAD+ kinase